MTKQTSVLTWAATPVAPGPIAQYTVDPSVDLTWLFSPLYGSFGSVNVRPNFLVVDNFFNDQIVTVNYGAMPFRVGAFTRLTLPIPIAATQVSIAISGGLSPFDVIFAVDDLSKSDGVNFKGIQTSIATGGALEPIDPLPNGNINILSTDLARQKFFTITVASQVNLPLSNAADIGNGFWIGVWNASTSTASVTVAVSGADQIETSAGGALGVTCVLAAGQRVKVISDGAGSWRVVAYSGGTTSSFVSAAQVITSGGNLTLAHGLGAVPNVVETWLQCAIVEAGWAVGDIFPWGLVDTNNIAGIAASADATNVRLVFYNGANTFVGLNKGTGANAIFTNANWRLVVKARV